MIETTDIMKAAHWISSETIEVRDIAVPTVTDGSILLRVKSCSICGSDLRIYKHGNERIQSPKIIGHEISGEIVAVGAGVENFLIGDRVSVGADIPCGECYHCVRGHANNCVTNLAIGYQFDGGFAEYLLLDPLVVRTGPIQKFSKKLDFDGAALAEPLACCVNGYEVGLMTEGKTVAIFGAGPIGLMLSMLSKFYKASKLIVIDPNANRLEKILDACPKAIVINAQSSSLIDEILFETDNIGVDLVFTACPVVETHTQALKIVARRGVINFFGGLPKSAPPIQLFSNDIHYKEIYITGSHGSTPKQHKEALRLLEEGEIDSKKIISHKYKLNEIESAFEKALSFSGMKVMINPNE